MTANDEDFLRMQQYNPEKEAAARYALTFDFQGMAFARLLVSSPEMPGVDLADLYGHPWEDWEVAGYSNLWVSRVDGTSLSAEERERIKEEVTYDLRFDYGDDELEFWFDDSLYDGTLCIYLRDPSQ